MAEVVKTLQHHIEIEQRVIHLMLKSREVVDEMLEDGYASDFFDEYHQYIVQAIFEEFLVSNRKRLLSREAFRQRLITQGLQKEAISLLSVYDKCRLGSPTDLNDLGFLKKQLTDAYVGRRCRDLWDRFRKQSEGKGFLFAASNLLDDLQTCLGVTETRRSVFVSLGELKDEYIKELKELADNPSIKVKCNIPEIDDSVRVGFRPQHLTLFVADVGCHKTNLMLNVALNIYDSGHSVLFIPLEMGRFDLCTRIVCNRVGVSNDILAEPENLSPEQWKKIIEAKIWLEGNEQFCILDADDRTSVLSLQREIEKRVRIFEPKVVIIDYIDNLQSDVRYGSKTIEIGEILKSLRFLGKRYGFHIISAAQMNRAAIKALREGNDAALDSTSIHGSHNYSADSDTIFALQRVPNEPNKIKIVTIKARHGPSGHSGELSVKAPFYQIFSTKDTSDLLIDPDLEPLETTMDRPTSEIAEGIEEDPHPPSVQFASDLGDLEQIGSDDLTGLG